jgi:hypothetical protein
MNFGLHKRDVSVVLTFVDVNPPLLAGYLH